MAILFLLAIVYAFLCAALAQRVGDPERRDLSFTLGLLLGPIGVVVAALITLQPARRPPVPDEVIYPGRRY